MMRAEHFRDVCDIAMHFNLSNHNIGLLETLSEDENYYNLVWTYKKRVCGYLISRLIIEETNIQFHKEFSKNNTESEAELHEIAVIENLHNQQAGTHLLKALIKKCFDKKIQKIWIEVRKSNGKALHFYKKHNFELIDLRRNYYSKPAEDALIMKLDLNRKIKFRKLD